MHIHVDTFGHKAQHYFMIGDVSLLITGLVYCIHVPDHSVYLWLCELTPYVEHCALRTECTFAVICDSGSQIPSDLRPRVMAPLFVA